MKARLARRLVLVLVLVLRPSSSIWSLHNRGKTKIEDEGRERGLHLGSTSPSEQRLHQLPDLSFDCLNRAAAIY
jgi:hypothetical protein